MAGIAPLLTSDVDFAVEKGVVDTFLVGFPDMFGRLLGTRVTAGHFVSSSMQGGVRVPSALMTLDAGMERSDGYAIDSWEVEHAELTLRPDAATFFRMPWASSTMGVLGDLEHRDGTPVEESPRRILQQQVNRLNEMNLHALAGAAPGLNAFQEDYSSARQAAFNDLSPLGSTSGSSASYVSARAERLLGRIRSDLAQVPIALEGTAGERGAGRYSVAFHPEEPLRLCDNVVIAKDAIKQLAELEQLSVTFMAQFGEYGSTGHLSLSLKGNRGNLALVDRYDDSGLSEVGKSFVAGLTEHATELTLFYAPRPNSYRRLGTGADPVARLTWGRDALGSTFRVIGTDASLRIENELPGSDANPHLAMAAMIASGIDGIKHQIRVSPLTTGSPDASVAPRPAASLEEALAAWEGSEWVRRTFGAEVHDHYATMARIEIAAARDAGDDSLAWERSRSFESA